VSALSPARFRAALVAGVVLACLPACKQKATPAQCDQLLERYASLVVLERFPDAGADRIKAEQEHEKSEARNDDAFKNCSSEVSRAELDCAMRAPTADAFEKCLE
jgi:hypothetical protein